MATTLTMAGTARATPAQPAPAGETQPQQIPDTPHPVLAASTSPDSADAWFPQTDDAASAARSDPIRAAQAPAAGTLLPRERPLIPLPAAAWTGLIGLGCLAVVVGRKALLRFVS
jgi:hypothetical protein